MLQAKNLKTILWGFTANTVLVDVIAADSAFELARRNHGALIVIPGDEDIHELIQGGIDWNGDISREIILSIFFPVHIDDGAAVIEGDRVTRVGAILPLSRRGRSAVSSGNAAPCRPGRKAAMHWRSSFPKSAAR